MAQIEKEFLEENVFCGMIKKMHHEPYYDDAIQESPIKKEEKKEIVDYKALYEQEEKERELEEMRAMGFRI